MLDESRLAELVATRAPCDTYLLYARRALASGTYWTVQVGDREHVSALLSERSLSLSLRRESGARATGDLARAQSAIVVLIVVLTVLSEAASATISAEVDTRVGGGGEARGGGGGGLGEALGDAFVPAAVTVINAVSPVFIQKLTDFERWDDERSRVTRLLLRMYLAKVMNAVILVFSFTLLGSPYMLATRDYQAGERSPSLRGTFPL